jgi:hypothetical protein
MNAIYDAIHFNVENVVAAFGPSAAFFPQRNTLRNYQCHSAPPEVSLVNGSGLVLPWRATPQRTVERSMPVTTSAEVRI